MIKITINADISHDQFYQDINLKIESNNKFHNIEAFDLDLGCGLFESLELLANHCDGESPTDPDFTGEFTLSLEYRNEQLQELIMLFDEYELTDAIEFLESQ